MASVLAAGALVGFPLACALLSPSKKSEQTSNPSNKPEITAGGNVWNFNFQSVQQNAGLGTTALASFGWWVAHRGRRKEAQSFNKVADCLEDTACDTCKARVRKLRDDYIDRRVIRRFHPKRTAA